jgi:hypothetical protein
MERLKDLIKSQLVDFPDFDYYIPIIEKAENNQLDHPDISIECCNSIIQGICKTIILRLDKTLDEDYFKRKDTQDIIKPALKLLQANDDVYENDFVTRAVSLALAISTLRNARGDISHGKSVPKVLFSNLELARTVIDMTSSLMAYTLASFFALKLEATDLDVDEELLEQSTVYADNPDFNDYLDELYPLDGKMRYSEALYDKYYEDYEIQLGEFEYQQEQDLME